MTTQVVDPVDWEFRTEQKGDEAVLFLDAKVDKPWHMYSQYLEDGGPIPTSFNFEASEDYELIDKVNEGESVKHYDPNFKMDLAYFEGDCSFNQRIKIKNSAPFVIKGWLEYMVCNDKECLPPEMVDFEFNVAGLSGVKADDSEKGNTPLENSESDSSSDGPSFGQVKNPVKWTFSSIPLQDNKYEITYRAEIEDKWHLYSQNLEPGGAVPTYFEVYLDSSNVIEVSEVIEPIPTVEYDPNFEMDQAYFSNEVEFKQVATIEGEPGLFQAWLEFMVCNDKECMPPEIVDLKIDLRTGKEYAEAKEKTGQYANAKYELDCVDIENPYSNNTSEKAKDPLSFMELFLAFLGGMGGGLLALITPCVFPMIPLTVSFFTKGSEDKKKGKFRAITYGFFIFAIYSAIAIPFHIWNVSPDILNEISTGFWLNMIFFAVFVFFAGSFFGYYELTLPSSLANRTDSASNKSGLIGIFFMALTLAIVSFSCTGPILGSLLAGVLKGGPWPLTMALAGFGIALGFPFALFAMFPQLMNKLPSSGGWLNSVKVVLGFVELGLAVKFLSNADLVHQFGWVKRETFFLIWMILSLACGLYLFGVIKFPHDSPKVRMSPVRIGFATIFIAFGIYLFPGILKNPWWEHGLLAGFPPYKHYSWYPHESHCPLDLDCTDDFYIAQDMAVKKDKPIFIDFTGHACVNCRRMEENVWPKEEVLKLLNEEFQVVSLYVDDKRELPLEEQDTVLIEYSNGETKEKKIRTIGNKWSTLEIMSFANSTQPLYAILSPDGCLLNEPVGYTPNVQEYVEFLKEGIEMNKRYNKEKGLAEKN
ncbi:MAG: protein-disulfide reductase DsbD domain-containing protein [Bacteroidota bacterium]